MLDEMRYAGQACGLMAASVANPYADARGMKMGDIFAEDTKSVWQYFLCVTHMSFSRFPILFTIITEG